MPMFSYDARYQSGSLISGVIEGDSFRQATKQLESRQLTVLKIQQDQPGRSQIPGQSDWEVRRRGVEWVGDPQEGRRMFMRLFGHIALVMLVAAVLAKIYR